MFESVLGIVGPNIPLCYHECGPIPDPDAMIADGTKWVWFMTWHTIHIKRQNTAEYVKKVYNHPYVVTLDKLPNLKEPEQGLQRGERTNRDGRKRLRSTL